MNNEHGPHEVHTESVSSIFGGALEMYRSTAERCTSGCRASPASLCVLGRPSCDWRWMAV